VYYSGQSNTILFNLLPVPITITGGLDGLYLNLFLIPIPMCFYKFMIKVSTVSTSDSAFFLLSFVFYNDQYTYPKHRVGC
ncbi:hypothetical protein BDF14DRAFT_1855034, partial [Spinellus fusiger]